MLGQKLLDGARISVSDDVRVQYEIVRGELKKLCELSHMSWDLTSSSLFDAVHRVSFVEGVVCGAAIVGGIIMARKITKREPKQSEE